MKSEYIPSSTSHCLTTVLPICMHISTGKKTLHSSWEKENIYHSFFQEKGADYIKVYINLLFWTGVWGFMELG